MAVHQVQRGLRLQAPHEDPGSSANHRPQQSGGSRRAAGPQRILLADGRLNEFWLFVRSTPAPVNREPRAEFVLRWGRELYQADFRPSVAWELNYTSADWGRILGKRHRLLYAAVRHAVDHPDLDVEGRPRLLRLLWRCAGFDEDTIARHARVRLNVTAADRP
ncbi:hypothetical protein AB0O75_38505 [Streptomyces sp. NPDC088921]|uniref:hypothetical protein n=1 Tax=unclassified Streptomyces TaxID=2593676 RepID=UPI003418D0C9